MLRHEAGFVKGVSYGANCKFDAYRSNKITNSEFVEDRHEQRMRSTPAEKYTNARKKGGRPEKRPVGDRLSGGKYVYGIWF